MNSPRHQFGQGFGRFFDSKLGRARLVAGSGLLIWREAVQSRVSARFPCLTTTIWALLLRSVQVHRVVEKKPKPAGYVVL